VDVGTHKLYVVLTDVPSDLTVVLESGGGKYSSAYQDVQDALAQRTGVRVMSYDRSGFGQSELGPDGWNAIDEVAALRKCLKAQELEDKFVLVGHSYGGLLVQLFTQRYPELVSGLVLIDPMNVKFVDAFGLDELQAVTPYFQKPTQKHETAGNRMVDHFPEALAALRGAELPPNTPALLITAGNAPFSETVWRRCHKEMVMHSAKHQLLIAEGHNHDILEENPQLILDGIIELVDRVRIA
jgi:pimeloyl-ACP methyl ester carboxylesterase